ncbi:hypothetical protein [Nodularia chucula]|uniref:hypothetical protein n=1 Tax=Nodularia chucula TaxID=3093667 RepID=UPI0039C69F6B
MKLAPQTYQDENSKKVDAANQKLLAMEYQSFNLVNQSQKAAAQLLLSSPEYKIQKQIQHFWVLRKETVTSHSMTLSKDTNQARIISLA